MPDTSEGIRLFLGAFVVGPDGIGDFTQITRALRRNDDGFGGRNFALRPSKAGFELNSGFGGNGIEQGMI